jgi:non-specific protein-tyrosine kinase
MVNMILAMLLGIGLAGAVIALLEYRDNTVKGNAEFGDTLGVPLLSNVLAVPNITAGRKQLFVLDQPKGAAAESIRLLRTNIEFASATNEITTLGVTSANPSEGKSTIAANLAVTLAQAGFATALIDADLRRPSQHRIHGLSNDRGLSSLLTHGDQTWEWAAHPSPVPNLTVIPSGPLPPNPADLLSLDRLRNLLTEMRETFDVIVIDTPPVLAVSDPLIVAAHVDGMLVVTFAGKTRMDAIRRSVETLRRGSIRIVGVVVNRQTSKHSGDYYYQDYHAVADGPSRSGSRRRSKSPALEPGSTPAD